MFNGLRYACPDSSGTGDGTNDNIECENALDIPEWTYQTGDSGAMSAKP